MSTINLSFLDKPRRVFVRDYRMSVTYRYAPALVRGVLVSTVMHDVRDASKFVRLICGEA